MKIRVSMRRSKYSKVFKDSTVQLILNDGESVVKVAEDLGLNSKTLYHWVTSYKKEHNITILQPKRWEVIKKRQLEYGQENGLSIKFLVKYLEALHQESIRHQTAVMNK